MIASLQSVLNLIQLKKVSLSRCIKYCFLVQASTPFQVRILSQQLLISNSLINNFLYYSLTILIKFTQKKTCSVRYSLLTHGVPDTNILMIQKIFIIVVSGDFSRYILNRLQSWLFSCRPTTAHCKSILAPIVVFFWDLIERLHPETLTGDIRMFICM